MNPFWRAYFSTGLKAPTSEPRKPCRTWMMSLNHQDQMNHQCLANPLPLPIWKVEVVSNHGDCQSPNLGCSPSKWPKWHLLTARTFVQKALDRILLAEAGVEKGRGLLIFGDQFQQIGSYLWSCTWNYSKMRQLTFCFQCGLPEFLSFHSAHWVGGFSFIRLTSQYEVNDFWNDHVKSIWAVQKSLYSTKNFRYLNMEESWTLYSAIFPGGFSLT